MPDALSIAAGPSMAVENAATTPFGANIVGPRFGARRGQCRAGLRLSVRFVFFLRRKPYRTTLGILEKNYARSLTMDCGRDVPPRRHLQSMTRPEECRSRIQSRSTGRRTGTRDPNGLSVKVRKAAPRRHPRRSSAISGVWRRSATSNDLRGPGNRSGAARDHLMARRVWRHWLTSCAVFRTAPPG